MQARAFSLVELSIVLVILGLLVGGILAGQSLIRASELRAVATEYQRYVTAMHSFRDKYFAIPGDMANATSIWGTAGTCPGTSASPSTSAATCNGDGNGLISNSATNANEVYRFWHHLANAGLVEGTYTGVSNNASATTYYSLPGTNVPKSKLGNAGYTMYNMGTQAISSTLYFEGTYGLVMFFGSTASTNDTESPVLKPEEAWNIDTKLDDGKPATGSITGHESMGGTTSAACSDTAASTSVSQAASNYSLANTGLNCALIFKTGY